MHEDAMRAVAQLLDHVAPDWDAEDGMADTPRRVVAALEEMTSGYHVEPSELLATQFNVGGHDGMVVLQGVPFVSLCEHHLLPFAGTVTIGYLPAPDAYVVGLSKLARLVECYARRLQVQERMTSQLVEALMTHLAPLGAAAQVRAHHQCMSCRGVRKAGTMVTQALDGVLRTEPGPRSEFLALCAPGAP